MNKKIIFFSFLALVFLFGILSAQNVSAQDDGGEQFLPLVQCGNAENFTDPCTLCHAFQLMYRIIQFGFYGLILPVVAIAFLIGGIILLISAGNASKLDRGKSIVWNTFLGFLVAFAAWLVISTILVNITPGVSEDIEYPGGINLKWYQFPDCTPGTEPPLPGISLAPTRPATEPPPPGGTCPEARATSPCSTQALSSTCFGSNAKTMSIICSKESSGGKPTAKSTTDKCSDGSTFSHGLFQINMIAHADKLGGSCVGLFQKEGDGSQGSCLNWSKPECTSVSSATGCFCKRWNCWVAGGGGPANKKYQECVTITTNIDTNIRIACEISGNGSNLNPWSYTAGICNLR